MDQLFQALEKTPDGAFFNPWFQRDPDHDRIETAPEIRREQLRAYLSERIGRAKYLCVAEALGYQGGHFTGIAMTSERILLGHHEEVHGIPSTGAMQSVQPQRTSKPSVNRLGMTEPTATIVWKSLYKLGVDPFEVVLWNALAWHPYDPAKGMLSNRTPSDNELSCGFDALGAFLDLFPEGQVIAVGKKAVHCLDNFGVDYLEVRHPANGGAPKFRRQFASIVRREAADA